MIELRNYKSRPPIDVSDDMISQNHMHNQIQEQIKDAMRAKDEVRVTTLRGMIAAFMTETMNLKRKPDVKLSDEEAIAVIRRLVKQRKDSIEQFLKGNREDLANAEKAELLILEEFLPAQMSEEKVRELVSLKIAELGVTPGDKAATGKLMGAVIKASNSQADGALVKKVVEELLA